MTTLPPERAGITRGPATILPHESGGWALPGGAVELDYDRADAVAIRMAEIIGDRYKPLTRRQVDQQRRSS